MEEVKKLILIDSNAIIHRAYHALPKNMRTSKGELTNVVYGYTTTLIKVLEDLKPDYIAASFDISKATHRLKEYSEYKATRVAADQELYDQIPRVRDLLKVLKIPVYEMEGYEADDCIGTIVEQSSTQSRKSKVESEKECDNLDIYIISGDKDLFQLLNGHVFVYWLKKGLGETQIVNSEVVQQEFNLQPSDFIDLKALAGDSSDNIPGVPGIGPKTATDLIQRFDTLKKLYDSIEEKIGVISTPHEPTAGWIEGGEKSQHGGTDMAKDQLIPQDDKLIENTAKELDIKPRILNLLITYKDQAFMSQRLATICRDVPINFDLESCRWGQYDKEELASFFKEYQFHSLLRRFGAERGEEPKAKDQKEQKEKDEQLKLL